VRDLDAVFTALAASPFRAHMRLNAKDADYLTVKGQERVQSMNDGNQRPMRGHPAFVAQHATATCCRSCLA
jgi:hypothetical protein